MNTKAINPKTKLLLIVLFLAFCMGLAFFISWTYLIHQSMRLDESQSLWQTSFSLRGMLNQVAQDVHVPFYHIILHYWDLLWGMDPVRARLLSLIFYEASIPALFILARKYMGLKIAVFTTLIYTLSAFMNWYANEIRMYSLLVLVTIVSHLAFLNLMQHSRRRDWFFYGAVSVIGLFTHYYFTFVLLTQGLFLLIRRKDFPSGSLRKMFQTGFWVGLVFSAWGFYFLQNGFGSNTRPQLGPPSSIDFFNALINFVFGFLPIKALPTLESLWPLLILLVFLFVGSRKKLGMLQQYFLWQSALPMLAALLLSRLITPIFLSRYLIFVLPSLYILFNWYISCFKGRLNFLMQLALIQLFMISLMNMLLSPNLPVQENYRAVAQYLESKAAPTDVIALSAPFTLYPMQYYYDGPATVTTIPFWDTTQHGQIPLYTDNALSTQLSSLTKDHGAMWVVLSYDQGYQADLKSYLDHHYAITDQQQFGYDILVYKYKFKY